MNRDEASTKIVELEERVFKMEQFLLKLEERLQPAPKDPDVARQRWFDDCGKAYSTSGDDCLEISAKERVYVIRDSGADESEVRAAEVLTSRANALRGVGRPEKVQELLAKLQRCVDGHNMMAVIDAFDAIAYEPHGEEKK